MHMNRVLGKMALQMKQTINLRLIASSLPSIGGDSVVNLVASAEGCLVLGRSELTGILDKRCSRTHLKIWLDTEADEIVFQQLGSNPSCVHHHTNEFVLAKHLVKRIPLRCKASCSSHSTVYLISKDHLYGYALTVSANEQGKSERLDVVSETGVKHKSTLDDHFPKKPKKSEPQVKAAGSWTEPEAHVYFFNMKDVKPSSKIAAFDMDHTIITTASGAKWPKDKNDWKFLYPEVPEKLRSLHGDGYKIVLFTNQASIATGTVKSSDIKEKIESIIDKIGVPTQAVIAGCKHGMFRKPAPGMWDYIVEQANGDVTVSLGDSVFVGDAAGRPAGWAPGKKKDFACSDRLFALNIGVKFCTPEAFFKEMDEAPFEMPEFDPVQSLTTVNLLEPPTASLKLGKQEMVVMVGFPGSGKSFFSTHHLSDYERINRDILGSWQKCVAKAEQAIKAGKSVVVDNTNPDAESRSRYVSVAKKHNVPIRCFLMNTSYKQSRHNEKYRQLTSLNHKPIPDMVVHSYKSKYSEPVVSEGFQEIVKVNFLPHFENSKLKKKYSLHLLEK